MNQKEDFAECSGLKETLGSSLGGRLSETCALMASAHRFERNSITKLVKF